ATSARDLGALELVERGPLQHLEYAVDVFDRSPIHLANEGGVLLGDEGRDTEHRPPIDRLSVLVGEARRRLPRGDILGYRVQVHSGRLERPADHVLVTDVETVVMAGGEQGEMGSGK